MEPTKITSIAELQLRNAGACAKSIVTLIDDLSFAAPEDIDGHRGRLAQIAARLTELTQALKIAPPRPTGAADAPAVHDLQQRIQALEGNIRRHREQRAVILEALGGVTWEQAVPRARELLGTARVAEAELASIHHVLPQGDAVVPLSQRVAQLVSEHREMAEEMTKGADPVDVLKAAQSANDLPAPRDDEPVGLEDVAIAGTISALAAVITTSALDWERYPCLAWVYGVLVGHGADALDQLQQAYGWGDGTVEEIEGHRRVLLAARGVDVL